MSTQHKWFERDGHIFSEKVVTKKNADFRFGDEFSFNEAIAFNVGQRTARHIVKLHNASLTK